MKIRHNRAGSQGADFLNRKFFNSADIYNGGLKMGIIFLGCKGSVVKGLF